MILPPRSGCAARSAGGASFPAPPAFSPRHGAERASLSRAGSPSDPVGEADAEGALDSESRRRTLRGTGSHTKELSGRIGNRSKNPLAVARQVHDRDL